MKELYITPRIHNIVSDSIGIAVKSSFKEKHSCVLLNGKKIIDKIYYNDTCHAEIKCINEYFKKYNKMNNSLNILVIRSNNKGELMMSKPCLDCLKFIKKYKINFISYSNENGIIIKENVNDFKTDHISKSKRKNLI